MPGPVRDIVNRKGARCESDDDKCDANGMSSHEVVLHSVSRNALILTDQRRRSL